jgi:transcriptional regulator with XRE-family HTH domain
MSERHKRTKGVAVHATEGNLSDDERAVWHQWMRDLGQQLRRLREFAGLSQDQVARLAGVSQGAVSRLEIARGLATPLMIVMKINLALAGELRKLDQAILDPDLRRPLDIQDALRSPERALRPEAIQLLSDPHFTTLVRLYRETPERRREGLLAIMSTVAAGLKGKATPED